MSGGVTKVGIVGAGKLGIVLARAALDAGMEVMLTSRSLETLALTAEVMAPGARTGTLPEVTAFADLVVLALPLHRVHELPAHLFDGRIVVDTVNYWEPIDGQLAKFGIAASDTSLMIQRHFAGAKVVKSLNQLGYRDLDDERRPKGAADRIAVAVAGDDADAVAKVAAFVDRLGFDPVPAGGLAQGARLAPDGAAFGAALSENELRKVLGV